MSVPFPISHSFPDVGAHVRSVPTRTMIVAVLGLACLFLVVSPGLASQSPFGVALPDTNSAPVSGPLKGFFLWVAQQQSAFYKAMVEAVKAIKISGNATWILVGLSFLYGVFHAAGPGHGKVVLSSYVLASNETARTGVVVSFAAAMVQAVSAIVLIGIAALVLNMTSIAITDTTSVFETGSYALVTGLGLFLVWKKVLRPLAARIPRAGNILAYAHSHGDYHGGHDHHGHHHHGHDHDEHCCHVAGAKTAEAISASKTPVKDAIAAIFAVGLRPCSGALIVLVFALSQGLFWAGILATFAMALGTGIVVSGLVLLSVTARNTAVRLAGADSPLAGRVLSGIEGVAAILVLGLGLTLLTASFMQPALS